MNLADNLRAAENAVGILSLRERGEASMVPAAVAKYTDAQIATALLQAATRVYAEIQEREGDQ